MSIISSLLWKYLERTGNQAVQFGVQVVLARLLSPEDFGVIALMLVFTNMAQVFVQSGFSTALIQAREADDRDFSSVFYLSLGVAGVLYVALYFSAPAIAVFYKMPQLVAVLRVLSVILFFGAVNSIQNAVVARDFKFKQLFYSSFGAIVLSGSIGIYLAYCGYGIWALVWQQVWNQLALCGIMLLMVKWRPRLLFSWERLARLFSFGWKLLVSALLDTGYREAQSLVIGRLFSASGLGFFNRGGMFPQVVVGNIDGSIQSVLLPVLSQIQDDPSRIKEMMRRAIAMSAFVISPLMAGMIATAEPVVRIMLTDKWLPCVPFMQICCISFIFYPIHTSNLSALNALGRSDIFLRLEIIKKIINITVLAITIIFFRSITAIAWSAVLGGVIATFINAYPNKRLISYKYTEQLRDIMPSLVLSALMGTCVYAVGMTLTPIKMPVCALLFLQIVCGVVVYAVLAKICRLQSMAYLINVFWCRVVNK